jgi:hypothetical protein
MKVLFLLHSFRGFSCLAQLPSKLVLGLQCSGTSWQKHVMKENFHLTAARRQGEKEEKTRVPIYISRILS